MGHELEILKAIDDIGDPLMKHITKQIKGGGVSDCVMALLRAGLVRQKEDPYDHDWSYRLTTAGKARLEYLKAHR